MPENLDFPQVVLIRMCTLRAGAVLFFTAVQVGAAHAPFAHAGASLVNARCPVCQSDEFYWSRKGNDGVPLLVQLFLAAGRCRACGRISLIRGPLLLGPSLESPPSPATKRTATGSVSADDVSDSSADLLQTNPDRSASDSQDLER